MFRCSPLGIVLLLAIAHALAQTSKSGPAINPSISAEHGLDLAGSGHCAEAIPILRKAMRNVSDADLKKRSGLAGLRCAMTRNQPYDAIDFLQILSRDFPRDPEVLYQ